MKSFAQYNGRAPARPLLFAAIVAILAAACGKKPADIPATNAAAKESAGAAAEADAEHNPCSLLEPRDLEAALGGSLVGPAYRFDRSSNQWGPAADGDACRYEGANHHFIQIEVEWQGGAQKLNMYGMVQGLVDQQHKGVLKLGDGSELTGEWDEAKVVNCCTFLAMRGDQLVTVDIAGSNATLEQAAGIADAALKRIDKPLTVEVAAGVAAASARDATRPKPRDPCSLVSRAEAEAAMEAPLASDPSVDGSKCTYVSAGKLPWTIVLNVRWRDGYPEFREHAATVAAVRGSFAPAGTTGQNAVASAVPDPALSGPWEAAMAGMREFWAVKNDVLIKADAAGARKQEHARALVAAAMSKL
jgi:hypothetical protein